MNKEPQQIVIGCIRTADRDTPPEQQTNCDKWHCDDCGAEMWSSEKKRAIIAVNINAVKLCFQCIAVKIKTDGPSQGVINIADSGPIN